MKLIRTENNVSTMMEAHKLPLGTVGRIASGNMYNDSVVMRVWGGLVGLENAELVWTSRTESTFDCTIQVIPYSPGTQLAFEVEDL